MNPCTQSILRRLLLTISVGLLLASPALAQKGKGGGGGSSPSVLYRVIPIESTDLGPTNALWGINSSGQVCGWMYGTGVRYPYVWTVGSGMMLLQSLISSQDSETWHLETAGAINESGQIVGFMTRQDNPESWAAYRLDLADGARLTTLETGLNKYYATLPGGYHTEIQINDCGDVVLGANGTIYVYPAAFPAEDKIDLQYRGYTYGINCSGEIIVNAYDSETNTNYGDVRLTLDADGSYAERRFGTKYRLSSINDWGTIVGRNIGEPTGGFANKGGYTFRYNEVDGETILMDGRKTVQEGGYTLSNTAINNHGDIGLSLLTLYTAENAYLKIRDMIHPDDTLPGGTLRLMGIAERNESGLPPAIIKVSQGSTEDGKLIQYGYYLLPVPVAK